MTEGSNKGLFITVAIVIFGIFVGLTYLIFEDTLSPSLVGFFESSVSKDKDKDNEEIKDIIKDDIYLGEYTEDEVLMGLMYQGTNADIVLQEELNLPDSPITYSKYLELLPFMTAERLNMVDYDDFVKIGMSSSEYDIVERHIYYIVQNSQDKLLSAMSTYKNPATKARTLGLKKGLEQFTDLETKDMSLADLENSLNSLETDLKTKVNEVQIRETYTYLTGNDTYGFEISKVESLLEDFESEQDAFSAILPLIGHFGRQLIAEGYRLEDFKTANAADFSNQLLDFINIEKLNSILDVDTIVLEDTTHVNLENILKFKDGTNIILKGDIRNPYEISYSLTPELITKFTDKNPNSSLYLGLLDVAANLGYDLGMLELENVISEMDNTPYYMQENLANNYLEYIDSMPNNIKVKVSQETIDYLNSVIENNKDIE